MANILYQKLERQYSDDGGNTWISMNVYKVGNVIENPSDCKADLSTCRWRLLDASLGYTCDGVNKYQVEIEECTNNGGLLWTPTGNRRPSNVLIESNSCDCGYREYRWVVVEGEYICGEDSFTKYEKEVYSEGCGDNWVIAEPYQERKGDILECFSLDCGATSNEIAFTFDDIDELTYILNFKHVNLSGDVEITATKSPYSATMDELGVCELTSLRYCFNGESIIELLSIPDTTYVTDMLGMFYNCSNLINVDTTHFHTSNVTNMEMMFNSCSGLTSIDLSNFDTSNVISFSYMFYNCRSLTSLDLSNFNTSNVNNMNGMFYKCSGLTSLDLSNWNLSNIKETSNNADSEIHYSGIHNHTIDISSNELIYLNLSNTIGFENFKIFTDNCLFNKELVINLEGISFDNVCKIKDNMYNVFKTTNYKYIKFINDSTENNAKYLPCLVYIEDGNNGQIQFEINNEYLIRTYKTISCFTKKFFINYIKEYYDVDITTIFSVKVLSMVGHGHETVINYAITDEITDISYLYQDSPISIEQHNIEMWDTSNVTNMEYAFKNFGFVDCSTLNTAKVKNFKGAFSNIDIRNENHIDTSSAEDMSYMFNNNKTTTLDLSNWDISNVTDMSYMFENCLNLTTLDLSGWKLNNDVIILNMFGNCPNLTKIIINNSNCDTIKKIYNETLINQNIELEYDIECNLSTIDCTNDLSFTYGGTNQSDIYVKMNNITYTIQYPYSTSLEELGITEFTDANNMFSEDGKYLTYINNIPCTNNVTDMSKMFYECRKLTSLNLSSFDTSNVTTMSSMFYNCYKLTSLNLSSFDTSNVTTMEYMFRECKNLTSLDVTHFNTSAVTNMSNMFYYCDKLTTLDLSGWDVSNVTTMWSMFYDCGNLIELNLSNWVINDNNMFTYVFHYCSNLTTIIVNNCNETTINKIQGALTSAGYSSTISDGVITVTH